MLIPFFARHLIYQLRHPTTNLILIYISADGDVTQNIKSLISSAVTHSEKVLHVIIFVTPTEDQANIEVRRRVRHHIRISRLLCAALLK